MRGRAGARRARALRAAAAVATLLACTGPTQLYRGPRRPPEQTATIEVRPELHDPATPRLEVVRIDGRAVTGVTWSVLPGPHTIQVELDDRGPVRRPTAGRRYCAVRFEAAAGRTYQVRPEPAATLGAWVREAETGARFPGEACTRVLREE